MKSLKTLIIVITLIITHKVDLLASKIQSKMKNLNISGLVVDSYSLLPISKAYIYDGGNTKLGETDANGYFNVKISLVTDEEINFRLVVKKQGYNLYTQREHWGNIGSNLNVTYYFGIQNTRSKTKSFSEFTLDNTQSFYMYVKEGFNKVKGKIDFNHKIEEAKAGNNDLFFKVDENYYLISETGWVKLSSDNSIILINKEKKLPANEINFYVKRDNIKSMTPSSNKEIPFEINTY